MFYLIRNAEIRAAETFDTAARLVKEGWELTTLAIYRAKWQEKDEERFVSLAVQLAPPPLQEREV